MVCQISNKIFITFLIGFSIFTIVFGTAVKFHESGNESTGRTNLSSSLNGTTASPDIRRNRFYREWRRGDPSVHKHLWNSKTPLGKAELYIVLALVIGFATVVVGCWLSDNCWSPEPEHAVMIA